MNKTKSIHELLAQILTASGSLEKICCFLFCLKVSLHPCDRIGCHLVPWPYAVVSHTVPWTLMWHFTNCLFKNKKQTKKKRGGAGRGGHRNRGRRYSEVRWEVVLHLCWKIWWCVLQGCMLWSRRSQLFMLRTSKGSGSVLTFITLHHLFPSLGWCYEEVRSC